MLLKPSVKAAIEQRCFTGKSYCEIVTSCVWISAKPHDFSVQAPSSAGTLGKRSMKFLVDSKNPQKASQGRYANFIFFSARFLSALSWGCAKNTQT